MPQPLRVIINADDLGISAEVNEAILEWAEDGIVTSVSAMGAAPCQDSAIACELEGRGVSVGVHCNLSQFTPLTTSNALQPLLRADGTFDTVVRTVESDRSLRDAVADELLAQIEAVRDLGVDPSHLDSHHHDHFILWMMRVYRNLRLQTGINRVRGPLSGREIGAGLQQFVRVRARDVQRHVFGFATPDRFVDLAYLGTNGLDELKSMSGVVEVMTHPGDTGTLETERSAGEALRDADWTELVSYRAI